MPDYNAILAFYQMVALCCSSGALEGEAECCAGEQFRQVTRCFLSPVERTMLPFLSRRRQRAQFRAGALRFRAWEAANPDISALLRRKAEMKALSAG